MSLFGRDEPQNGGREEVSVHGPALREEAAPSVGERTSGVGIGGETQLVEGFPVPWHLVNGLRAYPRLRDLVEGYLVVQERLALYEDVMSELDGMAQRADQQFWQRLDRKMSGQDLRADLPDTLLRDAGLAELVATFEEEREKARDAARAGRNPLQSAQSAGAAYTAVGEIITAAEEISTACKAEARRLLEVLNDTVSKIFARESSTRSEPESRAIDAGLEELVEGGAATSRDTLRKPLGIGVAPGFDITELSEKGAR
jgi:hypothetical protein